MLQTEEKNILTADAKTPVNTPFLIGHEKAEKELFDSFKSGHMHHAWLITGEKGIGKATLAYRMIRYIFSLNNQDLISDLSLDTNLDLNKVSEDSIGFDYDEDNDDKDDDFSFSSSDLIIPSDTEKGEQSKPSILDSLDLSPIKLSTKNPVFERLITGGLTDLKIVERQYSDASKTKLKSEISIDQIRDLKDFFSKTSSEGGYKIALIDCVDDMNLNSSNALLKILEEAPNKSLLFLICNNYEGLLDTIKSRCRVLKLHPLSDENMDILLHEYINDILPENVKKLISLARGSIGTALDFYNNSGIELSDAFYSCIPDVLAKKNGGILDIITQIGYSETKFKIFENLYISLLDNILRLNSGLNVSFASEKEKIAVDFCSKYLTNSNKIFKIREKILSYFTQVSILNLDYTAVIMSCFERLKNAY